MSNNHPPHYIPGYRGYCPSVNFKNREETGVFNPQMEGKVHQEHNATKTFTNAREPLAGYEITHMEYGMNARNANLERLPNPTKANVPGPGQYQTQYRSTKPLSFSNK